MPGGKLPGNVPNVFFVALWSSGLRLLHCRATGYDNSWSLIRIVKAQLYRLSQAKCRTRIPGVEAPLLCVFLGIKIFK
jgi:hypothetical protein